jgi:ornithine decarboxylase
MSAAELVAPPKPVAGAHFAATPASFAQTPVLALSPGIVATRIADLQRALPSARVHYAVKANPHPVVLRQLARGGASFDVASPNEIGLALAAGAKASELIYSNPVRSRAHLAAAARAGVRKYVVDTMAELRKTAEVAPGAAVLCRLMTTGSGSDWPLSRKYGADAATCVEILTWARALGLAPAGIAFHVGSQQRDPHAWDQPIAIAAEVFRAVRSRGLRPWLLDIGGGFPAMSHADPVEPLAVYGVAIQRALAQSFGQRGRPALAVEPGRSLVADAGVLVASVLAVCDRGGRRWAYLDAGVFTGLVETLDEAIRYRLDVPGRRGPLEPYVLAGPTCDSADVLYERNPVLLPSDLAEGDRVLIRGAGAYTSCYSTVGFNGFDPLPTSLVDELP